jgi:hypothetical protein
MSQSEAYWCDVCGTGRREANHWFIGVLPNERGRWCAVRKWDGVIAKQSTVKHLCGQACVHKFVDAFMGVK